jgi:hypothetical protein
VLVEALLLKNTPPFSDAIADLVLAHTYREYREMTTALLTLISESDPITVRQNVFSRRAFTDELGRSIPNMGSTSKSR